MTGSAEEIRAMSELLAADPGSLIFLPLAEGLLARGDLGTAFRVARKGAERHPSRADAQDLLARAVLAMGDAETAEAAWSRALQLAPEYGAAHRGLGFLRYQQGRYDEAEAHLAFVQQSQPDDAALATALDAVRIARAETQAAAATPAAPAVARPAPRTSGAAIALTGAETAGTLFEAVLGGTTQVGLLLDGDGLVVGGEYRTDGGDMGAVIGAHLSGVSDEADRAMRHFGLGAWTRLALESESATIAMAPVGDGMTLVAAPRSVPLGFVRRTLDQCAQLARQWLGGAAGGAA